MKYPFRNKFRTIFAFCLSLLILQTRIFAEKLEEAIAEGYAFNYARAWEILMSLPENPVVLKHRAWSHLKVGNYHRASEVFLALDQNDYEILFGLGLCHFLQKRQEKSFLYFKKCLEANKHCAAAEYFCGEIKSRQGFDEDAVTHYQNALKLDYNFIEARLKLARVYYNLKEYNNAFGEWTKIAYTDSEFKEAADQKKKLLALITKKPDEISPPRRIYRGTAIGPAPASKTIPLLRIGITGNVQEMELWATDGLVLYENDGIIYQTGPNELLTINLSSEVFKNRKQVVLRTKSNNSGIVIKNLKYASGFAWAGISDREYRGYFEINFGDSGFSFINIINIEEYLYSVLPSEMISSWPIESLRSQAVIARSEAFYKKNISKPHKKDNFDLCDDQHCQVYKGIKQESARGRDAVNSTRGEILVYKDKIIHSLYSSNCSGHTQSSSELKGWGDEPYLSAVLDGEEDLPKNMSDFDRWIKHPPNIFCAPSKYTYYAESRWIRIISQNDLAELINRRYKLGGIKKAVALKRSKSGHINHLRIEGTKGTQDLEKENLIRSIVLGKLRSTNFIVEGYGTSKDGIPEFFIFWGAGWGHAVGLCQSGAATMAERGYKYPEILKKYFKDTYIKKFEY